jgi:nucleolar protein 56
LTESNITELKKDIFVSKSLNDDDLKLIKELAEIANSMYSTKSKIENFITKRTKEMYPNLTNIMGPIITARILNMTKNLKRFAELPASTIQMIGAETALFRHLKYNKKPPKYGFLCEHPLMNGLNDHNKGKLARILWQ